MDTLHEGVLEDSGMDHSEIFINVLLLSTCQFRDLEIRYFSAAILCTCDCLCLSWLTNDILQKPAFSLENILYFPEIYFKHVGEVTNYNRIYIFFTSAYSVLTF